MVALELRLDEFDKNLEIMAKKVVYTNLYFPLQSSNKSQMTVILLQSSSIV